MRYCINMTETAKHDLWEIAFWIVEQSKDIGTAKRFITEIQTEIKKLDHFPNAGFVPKDRVLMSAGFRYIVYKDYLVFYSVDEKNKAVNVLAIFNPKKDYMRVIRKFI